MLISILVLGAVMIGIASIGTTLLIFQIQQVNNSADSAGALFAADAGLEAVSWCFFNNEICPASLKVDSFCPVDNEPEVSLKDSSININTECVWDKENGEITITSLAFKNDTTRILQSKFIIISSSTSTATSTSE